MTDFLDSNVIIYFLDDKNTRKRERAAALLGEALRGQETGISFQVVQEVLNATTRKLEPPFSEADNQRLLNDVLFPLWTIAPSEALYQSAVFVHYRYGYAFYDSLIIAAALEADAEFLYTEEMQHGQRIEQLTIVNPFL